MKKRVLALTMAATIILGTTAWSGCASARTTGNTSITFFGGAGNKSYYQSLATGFHKAYPKITVNVKTEADNNYNSVLERTIAGNNAPDIYAPNDLILDVKDNLAANLDSYSKKYKWSKKVPASILSQGKVSKNYVKGSGSLYEAGGSAGLVVGIFYNRSEAKKIGMTKAPTTLAEFEKYLAAAKKAKLTPIIGAGQDGTINHLESLLVGDYMGQKKVMNFVNHVKGSTINTKESLQAFTLLKSWIGKGYFNSDINSVNQQSSYGRFTSGDGVFMFQGSWMISTLDQSFKGKYGFIPFPKKDSRSKYAAMTGNMLTFSITKKSKHKDVAATFLNWLTTSAASKIANSYGFLSANGAAKAVSLSSSVKNQMQDGYSLVAKDNGFTDWLVNASSTSMITTTKQLQLLFADQTSPQEALKAIQQTYVSDLSSK